MVRKFTVWFPDRKSDKSECGNNAAQHVNVRVEWTYLILCALFKKNNCPRDFTINIRACFEKKNIYLPGTRTNNKQRAIY